MDLIGWDISQLDDWLLTWCKRQNMMKTNYGEAVYKYFSE